MAGFDPGAAAFAMSRAGDDLDSGIVAASITGRFSMIAQAAGPAVAVVQGDETLTYAALDQRSSQLARFLLRQGIGPGNVVALSAGRSIGSLVALLATLKTGAAYAPLDATAPSEYRDWVLRDCAARAGLAIDIMDRNLYERANDCRWWALSTAIQTVLTQSPAEAAARLTPILSTINGLYTVYSNLILFDATGQVVAVSAAGDTSLVGRVLGDEWVARTLALDGPQAYCVSPFMPTPLYGGRPTYIYCAAVRDPVRSHRVVGGIAIVFDSAPQLATMLADCLPETICVAGSIPTRGEVFVRIVGPKSNGFLWPNVVKFNTTKTEVWIQQISTGLIQYYLLPQLPTDSDTLPGIVDKMGFRP